uniref:Ig-like domain-containing protein n=1 Tax=Castor canadensis TaxID=51338 RepID=A0A8C0WPE4_CASCN
MAHFAACLILVSLLSHLTASAASGALKKLPSALGGSVTFPLNVTLKQIDIIAWTFNTSFLATIQPAMGGKQAIASQNRNKDRVFFPDGSYSLKLNKLRKNDSGVYRVEIYSSSSPFPFTQEYELHVYEHLSKPKVIMGLQDNKNGTCITNLTCSMEQEGEDVIYSWKALGQAANVSHDGPILPISWRLEEKDMTFICMARNPISSSSSQPIRTWSLCKGAAGDSDSSRLFLYLLVVPIPLCVIVLMKILLIMQTERGKEPIEDKKGTDVHREIPNYCLPSEVNTVYDTVPHTESNTEEDQTNTLYSIVQIPKMVKSPQSLPMTPDLPRQVSFENII